MVEYLERKSSWEQRAACKGTEAPDTFFSEVRRSRDICDTCPVKDECRNYAIAHDEYGIWGGTSKYQRDHMPIYIRDMIREVYLRAGLLEYRTGLEEWKAQREAQQQALYAPIGPQVA
jgi:WhiB family redox-sensing transcriptional regulator